jgi:DNA modification methylase
MAEGKILQGDASKRLQEMPAESVQMVLTSPPYWRQRVYGRGEAEIGHEETPEFYAQRLVGVAREIRRVLEPGGSLWLNLGDKYAAGGKGGGGIAAERRAWKGERDRKGWNAPPAGYKSKDLTLSPFLVAEALRADGWYLRQTVIWDKGCGIEPLRRDRPSSGHEYVFLFARDRKNQITAPSEPWWGHSVWRIAPEKRKEHVAPMPRELARRCIVAGSLPGQTVLDPFAGSGTSGEVALEMGRRFVGVELYPETARQAARGLLEAQQTFLSQLPEAA